MKDLINSNEKVLVKFGAKWCGPCKIMGVRLEKMKEQGFEQKHNTLIHEVDVEEFPELGAEYKIRSMPTFILFHDGIESKRTMGRRNILDLEKMVSDG